MAKLPGDWPINASTTSGNDLADKLNRLVDGTPDFSGGTFTGYIYLNADPTTALGAATKQYVDNKNAALQTGVDQAKADAATAASTKVSKSGDTMTGALVVNGSLTTGAALNVNTWTITDEGAGIVFRHGGAVKLVIRLDGSIEVPGNVSAFVPL